MSDPRRLWEDCPDEFQRELIRSWRLENPSSTAWVRTARALGIAAGSAAAATLTATTAGALGGSSAAAGTTVLVAVKWSIFGAVLGVAVSGGSSLAVSSLSGPTPGSSARSPGVVARAATIQSVRGLPTPAVADEAPTPTRATRLSDRTSLSIDRFGARGEPLPGSSPASIAAEIALLDRARAALGRHDPGAALEALDRLAERPGPGTFAPEATLVRIEALGQAGRDQEARQLALWFIGAHPESPSVPTLRRRLEKPSR